MLYLATALLFGQLVQAAPGLPPPLSSYWPDIGPNANLIAEIHDGASVALVGLLTPQATVSVQNILDKKSTVRALYIDSPGGDLAAAMALAELVRERKLRVVVAGRCLSACANYVFTAAIKKDVLPGSLVGIHGKTIHMYMGDKMLSASAHDMERLIAVSPDPSLRTKIAVIDKTERDFYGKLGISTRHHDAFERYSVRRAAHMATTSDCRAIEFWVLRRTDLAAMGVTGMDAVWEPAGQAAASRAAARLGLGMHAVFFGDTAALEAQCKPANRFTLAFRSLFLFG